jgi:acylphosphatase
MPARQLRIHGRVQGVGYRWAMARHAHAMGITGWVRNRSDGSVEAVVAGSAEQLPAIIDWARRGPAGARVTTVEVTEIAGEFLTFEQLPTV